MKRTLALIIAPPIVGTAAVIIALLAMAPTLPAEFAVHWTTIRADGVGGLGDLIGPPATVVPILVAIMVATFLVLGGRNSSTVLERALVILSSFSGLGVAFTSLGLALAQRGSTDAAAVTLGEVAPWIGAGFVLAAIIGVGFALLTRPVPIAPPTLGRGPAALQLAPGERASWSRSVSASARILVPSLVVFVVIAAVFLLVGLPWVAVVYVVLGAVVLSNLVWSVRVDAGGLRVRSAFGVPRFSVAASDVLEARVIPVDPLRQFGGWGIRVGGGTWGVIIRAGEAIEVVRAGKSSFVVTVDDAETAATLLNAEALRAHAR